MKKLVFLALISAGAMGFMQSCKKDDPSGTTDAPLTVAEKQRSLLIYNTATWCGPCGSVGSPTFKSAIDASNTDDLVMIDLHPALSSMSFLVPLATQEEKNNPDSLYYAPFSVELYQQSKPNGYIPQFYCSNSVLGNSAVTKDQILEFASNYNSAVSPEVGVAVKASASDKNINITYKMKALEPESGAEYYTSLLVIEKSVDAAQVVGSSWQKITHKNIVRGSAKYSAAGTTFGGGTTWTNAPVAFGDAADMTNPSAGSEIEKTATYKYSTPTQGLKDAWDASLVSQIGYGFGWWNFNASNTAVVAIVWKKISNTEMFYVNAAYADVK